MTYLIKIYFCKVGQELRPLSVASAAILHDQQLFGKLHTLLNPFIRPAHSCDWILDVAIDSTAPELQEAFALLAGVGLSPVFQSHISPEQRGKFFPVRRERPPFPLDGSNWVQVMCVEANRGGQIVSFHDGQLVATASQEEAKRPGRCLDLTSRVFAVTEDFKKSFEVAGLVGGRFRPLIYSPPSSRL